MKRLIPAILLVIIVLSGCSAFLNIPKSPEVQIQKSFTQDEKWWLAFNDPLMEFLTDKFINQNLDLQIALTRIEEARAQRRVIGSALFPEISASGIASRSNSSLGLVSPQTTAQAGFDAAWEVDLFKSKRSAFNASEARLQLAQVNAFDVRRIIIADLIRASVEWRQAKQTLKKTQNLLTAQSNQVTLFKSRVDAGLIDATFLERALAQREQTATQIPLAEAASKTAQYQIERLLGKKPESLTKTLSKFAKSRLFVPQPSKTLDIPLETIKDRPDIRAAAFNILAAQADLREAEANLWPRITLSAFFGVQKTSSGLEAMTVSNPIWSLANSFTAPLINFGRLLAAVNVVDAKAKRAALEYENTILLALQESRTALSNYLNRVNAVNRQLIVLKHRKETVILAKERFKRGLTDMTDLTTAQAEFDQAAIALIDRKASAAIAYISLQKAIGL